MMKHFIRLSLILLLVSQGCSLLPSATPRSTPKAVAELFVTAGPNSTATPTPFQPVGPTATYTLTATPLPTNTPKLSATKALAIPTPIRVNQKLPEGVVNLLVLGNDA